MGSHCARNKSQLPTQAHGAPALSSTAGLPLPDLPAFPQLLGTPRTHQGVSHFWTPAPAGPSTWHVPSSILPGDGTFSCVRAHTNRQKGCSRSKLVPLSPTTNASLGTAVLCLSVPLGCRPRDDTEPVALFTASSVAPRRTQHKAGT